MRFLCFNVMENTVIFVENAVAHFGSELQKHSYPILGFIDSNFPDPTLLNPWIPSRVFWK